MAYQRKVEKKRKRLVSALPTPSSSSSYDRFTDLPDVIVEEILARLHIRDAVRTSALSTRWRYRWHGTPSVTFDTRCLPLQLRSALRHQTWRWAYLARAVDHVLTLHLGPVRCFRLAFDQPGGGPDVDRWLVYLRRHLVEVLNLSFSGTAVYYKVPSHLFLCGNLRSLWLSGCRLNVPHGFTGFKALSVLMLRDVKFAGDGLGGLVSSCPLLWRLFLDGTQGCRSLTVSGTELVEFKICRTTIAELSFGSTPRLAQATIGLHCDCNLFEAFNVLLTLSVLQLVQESVLVFAKLIASDGLAACAYDQLTTLHLDIDFASSDENLVALYFLRGSPNLQQLSVQASSSGSDLLSLEEEISDLSSDEGTRRRASHFWENHERLDFSLDRLVEANIAKIVGMPQEMVFIKFILASSPALRTMTVNVFPYKRVSRQLKVSNELLKFRRASAQAEVFCSDKAATK